MFFYLIHAFQLYPCLWAESQKEMEKKKKKT